ncbi:hypothetical protein CAPTEDRAFT_222448 [Capitella teleta]|uniref:WD repeat-containing protein 93 n=1 Tax=Capitella teleta TaxID=283909 RepID=R7VCL0_CAPTE|nr:hypothetical protein CAPTEDRAFT_222448 [Capitella teleta]|eukprot:ELU13420.1 hypothetical protein CAPTEDRAFT_222448 [Capitella teleta]
MPVYLRKDAAMSVPSATAAELACDDPDDFIGDPDQLRDKLPQPFRMIDKVVNQLIENAMNLAVLRENEQVREATIFRPPQYESESQILENPSCLASSKDGQYVFLGSSEGLSVIAATTKNVICRWYEDKMHIVSLNIAMLKDHHLICSVDDFGVARVFAFSCGVLFLLHTFLESGNETKSIVRNCESSSDGDYFGIFLQNTESQSGWLEVHKSPKDMWVKDIDGVISASSKKNKPMEAEAVTLVVETETAISEELKARSQSPSSQTAASPLPEKSSLKFSPPQLVLKVKPPQPVTGVQWSSALNLMKTIDSTGDVVGSGCCHQISQQHLDLRLSAFKHLHSQLLPYKKEETPAPLEVGFHFHLPGRLMPHSADQSNIVGGAQPGDKPPIPPVAKGNCAGASRQGRESKARPITAMKATPPSTQNNVEYKPDMIWPMSSAICTSSISPCSSLSAYGLINNMLVIWDHSMGVLKRIVNIDSTQAIKSVHFLEPGLIPQPQSAKPYAQNVHCILLVVCDAGDVFLAYTEGEKPAEKINIGIENDNDTPTMITPIDGAPHLLFTCRRNGTVCLHSILDGQPLCEVTVPEAYSLSSPWKPIVCLGNNGRMLFAKGETEPRHTSPVSEKEEKENEGDKEKDTRDEEEDKGDKQEGKRSDPTNALFIFNLESFPVLEKILGLSISALPFVSHPTMEERVNAQFRRRQELQDGRVDQLQQRWTKFKEEIESIKRMKATAHSRVQTAFTASTIVRTPLIIGKRVC